MSQSLNGKTALLTGGSRGIGRAIAERLAADGATVALTYNSSKTGAEEAVAEIEKAGGSGFGGLDNATPESFDAMFNVFVRAPFFVVQAALSRLSDGGRVINVSSGFATRPSLMASMYSMAKGSINVFTHTLAIELGPRGITANAVAPGWTRTDMNAAVRESAEMVTAIETDTALGRFGEPSDIAAVVAFLASDEGRWVTGQIIEASGGYRL